MVSQVGVDGVIKLCEDLEVGEGPLTVSIHALRWSFVSLVCHHAEDVVMLVLAWLLKAAKMAEFTKVRGWRGPVLSLCHAMVGYLFGTIIGAESGLSCDLVAVVAAAVGGLRCVRRYLVPTRLSNPAGRVGDWVFCAWNRVT